MFAVAWEAVTLAGAFILGAVFAVIGVLRVVRAVAVIFDERRPGREPFHMARDRPPAGDDDDEAARKPRRHH